MRREWPGVFFDGVTATRHAVTIFMLQTGIQIVLTDGRTNFWLYKSIRVTSSSLTHEPVHLQHLDSSGSFIVQDASFLPVFQEIATGRRHPLTESSNLVILSAGLASVVGLAALIIWAIPRLADIASPIVPVSWETRIGLAVYTQLAPEDKRCKNQRLTATVDGLVALLAGARAGTGYSFHVTVTDESTFNALAAPGGYIIVYRPLLQASETPEELAGVLAHEMQHVLGRHATKALLRDLSLGAIVGTAFGDMSGITVAIVQTGRTLTLLHYSRETEEEADRGGLLHLRDAGINPSGMIRFFEKLNARLKTPVSPAYLSTHPDTNKRIALLKDVAAENPHRSSPLSMNETWKEIKELCH